MNILIIGPIPPIFGGASFGGIATHIEGLSNALNKKNHLISLWYHKPQKKKKASFQNITVITNSAIDYVLSIFFISTIFFRKELAYLTIKQKILFGFQAHKLKKILKINKFDCVHIHSLHNTSAIAFQYINKKLRPPLVITDHGFWQDSTINVFDSKSYNKIKAAVKQCEKVIYISNYAKEQHLKLDFGQLNKLVKIKNPIVIGVKIERQQYINEIRTIFFNGLTESLKIKQLDLLLKTIQEDDVLRNTVQVIALANAKAHEYVAKNKFSFNIELKSSMPWEEVKAIYKRSDIFVLPSKSESFGLAYLEALCFGLPIVAFEDVFNEFQSNIPYYIGEPFNSELETNYELANKIKKVLNTPFNYSNVYNSLKKEYNWESNIVYYEEIYKEV